MAIPFRLVLLAPLLLVAACASTPDYPPAGYGQYRVQPGDTLYRIARVHNQTVANLARWNRISDTSDIQAGQLLRVIAPAGDTVASSSPSRPAAGSKPKPRPAPPASTAKPRPPAGGITLAWPAQGTLLAGFTSANKGIDISGKAGDTVLAAGGGKVVYSGTGLRGYGKLVIVKHNNTYLTAYAHNQNLLVKEGQTVSKGQKIAEMGNTDADQVKLHFEIRRQGKPVDPLKHLPQR